MGQPVPAGPIAPGERVILIDAKGRRYLLHLVAGSQFHTHAGIVAHDDVIGIDEGSTVTGTTGRQFLVIRPTLADVVLKMPRGAQVIYPKDLGAILLAADIGPGMRVLEAGVGSGALSMALLRAGASVVGYEIREDFAKRAQQNVAAYLGPDVDYRVQVRDVTELVDEEGLDRIVLDMPEPWRVLPHAVGALRPGGIFLAYLPTINQTAQLRQALDDGPFGLAVTSEVLQRTWKVEPRSVRPDHRMVAHTGFLTVCRRLKDAGWRGAADRSVPGGVSVDRDGSGAASWSTVTVDDPPSPSPPAPPESSGDEADVVDLDGGRDIGAED